MATALLLAGCSSEEAATTESPPIVYNGGVLELGETYRYPFYIHCGMEWLIGFNDTVWTTDQPIYDGNGIPPEDLRQFYRNKQEQISPELWTYLTLVADDEIRLTLPDGSGETLYRPTEEEWPGCA